jgi:hypothetical protein
MDRCIEKRNVRHLRGRLFSELEPHTRSCVERLLVEEENKLGADLELIAEVERVIANFDALIVAQQALAAASERGPVLPCRKPKCCKGSEGPRGLSKALSRQGNLKMPESPSLLQGRQ